MLAGNDTFAILQFRCRTRYAGHKEEEMEEVEEVVDCTTMEPEAVVVAAGRVLQRPGRRFRTLCCKQRHQYP